MLETPSSDGKCLPIFVLRNGREAKSIRHRTGSIGVRRQELDHVEIIPRSFIIHFATCGSTVSGVKMRTSPIIADTTDSKTRKPIASDVTVNIVISSRAPGGMRKTCFSGLGLMNWICPTHSWDTRLSCTTLLP